MDISDFHYVSVGFLTDLILSWVCYVAFSFYHVLTRG